MPNPAQKDVRVGRKSFELHFPNISSLCNPTLTSFYHPWQPYSYIILPPLAAPLLHHITTSTLHCFSSHTWGLPVSWTHNLCTLSCVALTSRPSMLIQIFTVYIFEKYLFELPPLNKLHPHSYIILPPQVKLPPHSWNNLPPCRPARTSF